MITMIFAFVSLLSFRFRSRAGLELELVALRHQVAVLRRQRKGRMQLFSTDRLLWVWLYRIWPQALDAMVLVKAATVVQWHRKGFRLYWRIARLRGDQRHAWCIAAMANSLVAEIQSPLASVAGKRIPRSHRLLSKDSFCRSTIALRSSSVRSAAQTRPLRRGRLASQRRRSD
jgi:hypothetical protein